MAGLDSLTDEIHPRTPTGATGRRPGAANARHSCRDRSDDLSVLIGTIRRLTGA
jgi:hypothetical protein